MKFNLLARLLWAAAWGFPALGADIPDNGAAGNATLDVMAVIPACAVSSPR